MTAQEQKYCRLNSYGTVSRGRSQHRPRNAEHLYGGGFPFIQTADISNSNLYITSYTQTYTQAGIDQSKIWNPGVLCIVNAGVNTGDSAILAIKACFPDSVIGFKANPKKCNPLFIKYYLDLIKSQIRSITMGATQDNLSVSKLLSIPIPNISVNIQEKIAAILTAYDDLIETNKRRIALLEKMAEELYREWFVRMRFPGYQNTKFVKGVPEGWGIKRLGEILELAYGKALKDADREPGEFDVYGSGGIVGKHSKALVQGKGIIVGRKGNVGAVYYSDRGFFPIDTVYYVVSKLPLTYLFHLLQTMNFINNDAAVPGLNRNQAYSNQLFWPGENLVQMYAAKAEPVFAMKSQLVAQNKLLTQTRDLLLPRLISGKLSVEDLDIQLPPSMREEAG